MNKIINKITNYNKELTFSNYNSWNSEESKCNCKGCQDFFQNLESLILPTKTILNELGIDYHKPSEVWYSYDPDKPINNNYDWGWWYHFVGTITEEILNVPLTKNLSFSLKNKKDLVPKPFKGDLVQLEFYWKGEITK